MGRRASSALSVTFVALLLLSSLLVVLGTPRPAFSATQPAQVKLSGHPQGVALDFSNRYLYIANNNGYVLVFDPATNAVVKNITTGGSLTYIAYDNASENLYAAATAGVVVINGTTNTVVREVNTPGYSPYSVAAGVGQVFVTGSNVSKGLVKVIDTKTNTVTANITVPASFPSLSAYDSKDNRLYVADYYNNTGVVNTSGYANMTSVIDLNTNSIIANIRVPNGPFAVAYGFGKIFVTEAVASTVAVIDPSTEKIVANISVGYAPDGVAFSGDPLIAVSCYGTGGLGTTNFIDPFTDEPVGSIDTPNGPQLVIYDHWLGEFFVVQYDGFLQGFLQALIQPPPTTSSTSSSSTSSSTSSTTTTSSSPPTTGGGTTGEVSANYTDPILVAVAIALVALVFWWWRYYKVRKKKPCPPLETLKQQQVCNATYAKDWKRVLDMKLRGDKDRREADQHNADNAELTQDYININNDAQQLIADIRAWDQDPGSFAQFAALKDRQSELETEIKSYNHQANESNFEANAMDGEKEGYSSDLDGLIADLTGDDVAMRNMKCVHCTQIRNLVNQARALPRDWKVEHADTLDIEFPPISLPKTRDDLPPRRPAPAGGGITPPGPIQPQHKDEKKEKKETCCGPDVTEELVGLLSTVVENWKGLTPAEKALQALPSPAWGAGLGSWNIDLLRDKLGAILPAGCAQSGTPCDATVQVFGRCFKAGVVNYTLYGVMEVLTSEGSLYGKVVGPLLHFAYWVEKKLTVGTTLKLLSYENFMISVGRAFAEGGAAAMQAQIQKAPGESGCRPCPYPPNKVKWFYTWLPKWDREPSKY